MLSDFAWQSLCGLGEHVRPRTWRRAPRAALGLKQVHRRGAEEHGRGGRAPRDHQSINRDPLALRKASGSSYEDFWM